MEKSLFHGILKNTFSSISELISQFYFKLFKKFETLKDKGQDSNKNEGNEYIYKFFFILNELSFYKLPSKVKTILEDLPEDLSQSNSNDKNENSNSYEKNIKIFFRTLNNLLYYIYIFNFYETNKKLNKFIEYFDDYIIPFLFKTEINDIENRDYYELLYGGLCQLLFTLIIQINSHKKDNNFKNIDLKLVNNKTELKYFLFNNIIFYQCIKFDDKKLNTNIEVDRFKVKSKYTSNNINNLFLLLTVKDFNNKDEQKKEKAYNIEDYILLKLEDIHKSNFWIGNNNTSWRLNHKDKIKTNKFTGLRNFGNTCYMNSLTQILFNIRELRECILKCNVSDTKKNILYELKKLFFSLHYLDIQYYTPTSFQQNFEKGPLNPREQMDIDEFFSVLMDLLENRLKGTNNENIVKYIFQGKQNDNIIFDCKHKRTNESNFYSIQLQVKGKKDIYESLDTFIEGERMEGDNSIMCEGCNKKIPSKKKSGF